MIRFLAITVALTATAPAWAAQVVLLEAAKVSGGIVRLSDVAEVTGPGAETLRRAPLMPSPPPGGSRRLAAGSIRDMLRAQGAELTSVKFRGAYHVNVSTANERPTRQAAPISPLATPTRSRTGFRVRSGANRPDDVPRVVRRRVVSSESAIEQRIIETLQAELDKRPTNDGEPNRLAVKTLQMTQTAVDEMRMFDTTQLRAQFNVGMPDAPGAHSGVAWPAPRGIEGGFRVVADVVELPTRVVATQPIARGSTITRSSLRLEVVPIAELSRPSAAGFAALSEAIGKEAIRPIRANDVLSALNTAPPLLVRKGDDVSIVAAGGGIRVKLNSAVALGDGRLRDTVEVEAYDGAERFSARVIGDRQLALVVPGAETDSAVRVGGIR